MWILLFKKLRIKPFSQKIYKLSKTHLFFSRFEGRRGEKIYISHPRPDGDYHGEKNTFFLYAGDKIAGTNSTGTGLSATLRSPDFLVEEHPLECFSFWFYFGVSFKSISVTEEFCRAKFCLFALCTGL